MGASTLTTIKRLQKLFIFLVSTGILLFQVSTLMNAPSGDIYHNEHAIGYPIPHTPNRIHLLGKLNIEKVAIWGPRYK